MIKTNSFGDYFALLCHESGCLSEKGKRLSVFRSLLFDIAAARYPFAPAFYSCLPQLG